MKKLITTLLPTALIIAPALVFAQSNLTNLVNEIRAMVNLLIPTMVGVALITFFWGLVKFIFAQGSETAKTDGKRVMFWGIIALFVMVSVWGLVKAIQGAFGLTDFSPPTIPTI